MVILGWVVGILLMVTGAGWYLRNKSAWHRARAFYDAALDSPPARYDEEPEWAWRMRIGRLYTEVCDAAQSPMHGLVMSAAGIGIIGGLVLRGLISGAWF